MWYRRIAHIIFVLAINQPALAQDDMAGSTAAGKTYQELQQEIIRLKRADQVRDTIIKNLIRRKDRCRVLICDLVLRV